MHRPLCGPDDASTVWTVDAVEDRDPLVAGVVDEDPRQVGVGLQVLHRAHAVVLVGEDLSARRQAGEVARPLRRVHARAGHGPRDSARK